MKVIAVDFDGTLHEQGNPIQQSIDAVNKLFKNHDNFIVIYTARSYDEFFIVKKYLDKHNIKYHAIACEKLRATIYFDDRCAKFKEEEENKND